MMPCEEMELQRIAFLYELYQRSAGDPRQGVPYEALIDALRFGEPVTKSIQLALQQEGLIELTAVPLITTVGRPVLDPAHRRSCCQTIGITCARCSAHRGHRSASCSHGTCHTTAGSIVVKLPITCGSSISVTRP
jgi:hypothetical protein